jgi:hypothetical protein
MIGGGWLTGCGLERYLLMPGGAELLVFGRRFTHRISAESTHQELQVMSRILSPRPAGIAALALGCLFLLPAALYGQETDPAPPAPPVEAPEAVPAEQLDTAAAEEPAERPRRVRRNPNRITAEELEASNQRHALAIIQNLRPEWLRRRADFGEIQVYVDGMPAGGTSALANISRLRIDTMEYLSASAATLRFGTGNAAGAIVVRTR